MIIAFDTKIIFKQYKILKKGDAKIITKYNNNVNSIDLKLYVDLILSRRRFVFEFSFNYYFENKSLFESKFLIFNRINQINQIKFD